MLRGAALHSSDVNDALRVVHCARAEREIRCPRRELQPPPLPLPQRTTLRDHLTAARKRERVAHPKCSAVTTWRRCSVHRGARNAELERPDRVEQRDDVLEHHAVQH